MRLLSIGITLSAIALSACGSGGFGDDTRSPNQPPSARFTANPTSGVAPLTVNFNAAGSSDPDGTIVQYQWTFGDGQSGTGVTTSHTYRGTGTFNVKLTITDDDGEIAQATQKITVGTRVSSIRVGWNHNRDAGVHTTGGGYRVYYATSPGFSLSGANVVNVPNVSGSTPNSIVIQLAPGRYYIKVVAYTALNPTGSVPSQEISVTAQ